MGGAAGKALQRWEALDLRATVQALTTLPVEFAKDTTAACVAEMLQGHGRMVENYLYVFVGTFVGGGLVLAGHIVAGQRDNAGAIGSMPMGMANDTQKPAQLLQMASGWHLEQSLEQAGFAPQLVHQDAIMDPAYAAYVEPWLLQAGQALSMTAVSAAALMDLDAVIIDGSLGRSLVEALIRATRERITQYNLDGLQAPTIMSGQVGAHARALGGSLLPLHTQFFPIKDIFLKEDLA
jgi:predicted NBD/HSP70 family sugar kinase